MAEELRLRGALSRTMLMAGALGAMSQLTVDYTEQRQQFGKPVGRFQAVQQHLVWGAQDAAIAKMTAQVAAARASDDVLAAGFEIAAARTVAEASEQAERKRLLYGGEKRLRLVISKIRSCQRRYLYAPSR